jgi:tetratricopeptide (TPR) repeat protein
MTKALDPAAAADKLMEEGKYEEAARSFDEAIALAPSDLRIRQNKAVALWGSGRFDEAQTTCDQAIRLTNNRGELADLWRLKGIISEREARYAQALEFYSKALEYAEDKHQLMADRADVMLALGRFDEALAGYHEAGANRTNAADWTVWGNRFYEAGRPREANVCYDEALRLDRSEFRAHWGKGLATAAEGDLETSLRCFDDAVINAEKPEDKALVLTDEGNVLAQHPQRTAEALEIYGQALSLDPKLVAAAAGQATLLENQERWEEAAAAYDHAIGLNGNLADLWEGRARCLIQIPKRLEEALECYRKAIAIDPQSDSAHADAGWVLNELKRFDEGIAECEKAIEIDPSSPIPRANKSFAMIQSGRYQECERFLLESIRVVSDPKMLLMNLSLLYSDFTFEEEKGVEIERRLAISDSDANERVTLAELQLRLGNYAEARDQARKVLEGARSGAGRTVAEFISFAALILDGKYAESHECFANFLQYFQGSAAPVAEPDYYVRGLTKRLQEYQGDPMSRFVVLTLLDVLTGKLQPTQLSFVKPVAPVGPASPANPPFAAASPPVAAS